MRSMVKSRRRWCTDDRISASLSFEIRKCVAPRPCMNKISSSTTGTTLCDIAGNRIRDMRGGVGGGGLHLTLEKPMQVQRAKTKCNTKK